jgi:hypothetical protein
MNGEKAKGRRLEANGKRREAEGGTRKGRRREAKGRRQEGADYEPGLSLVSSIFIEVGSFIEF